MEETFDHFWEFAPAFEEEPWEEEEASIMQQSLFNQPEPQVTSYRMIPWCTSHYRLTFCKEKAKELRKEFHMVDIRRRKSEDGIPFGQIYVSIVEED